MSRETNLDTHRKEIMKSPLLPLVYLLHRLTIIINLSPSTLTVTSIINLENDSGASTSYYIRTNKRKISDKYNR